MNKNSDFKFGSILKRGMKVLSLNIYKHPITNTYIHENHLFSRAEKESKIYLQSCKGFRQYRNTVCILSEDYSDVIKKKQIIAKESRCSIRARNILHSRISEMVMLLQMFTFQYNINTVSHVHYRSISAPKN
jgi:hypothetical protein